MIMIILLIGVVELNEKINIKYSAQSLTHRMCSVNTSHTPCSYNKTENFHCFRFAFSFYKSMLQNFFLIWCFGDGDIPNVYIFQKSSILEHSRKHELISTNFIRQQDDVITCHVACGKLNTFKKEQAWQGQIILLWK